MNTNTWGEGVHAAKNSETTSKFDTAQQLFIDQVQSALEEDNFTNSIEIKFLAISEICLTN